MKTDTNEHETIGECITERASLGFTRTLSAASLQSYRKAVLQQPRDRRGRLRVAAAGLMLERLVSR